MRREEVTIPCHADVRITNADGKIFRIARWARVEMHVREGLSVIIAEVGEHVRLAFYGKGDVNFASLVPSDLKIRDCGEFNYFGLPDSIWFEKHVKFEGFGNWEVMRKADLETSIDTNLGTIRVRRDIRVERGLGFQYPISVSLLCGTAFFRGLRGGHVSPNLEINYSCEENAGANPVTSMILRYRNVLGKIFVRKETGEVILPEPHASWANGLNSVILARAAEPSCAEKANQAPAAEPAREVGVEAPAAEPKSPYSKDLDNYVKDFAAQKESFGEAFKRLEINNLNSLLCGISLEIPKIPVLLFGRLFDLRSLVAWVNHAKQNNKTPLCPITRNAFCLSDVQPAYVIRDILIETIERAEREAEEKKAQEEQKKLAEKLSEEAKAKAAKPESKAPEGGLFTPAGSPNVNPANSNVKKNSESAVKVSEKDFG